MQVTVPALGKRRTGTVLALEFQTSAELRILGTTDTLNLIYQSVLQQQGELGS